MQFVPKYPTLGVTELNPHLAPVSIPERGNTPLIMDDSVPEMAFGSKQCTIYCNNVWVNQSFLYK